jgi:hypothetical protein
MEQQNDTSNNRSIKIGKDASGAIIVTGDANQVTIYQTTRTLEIPEPAAEKKKKEIGPNPYLGLGAFQEKDAERFFGREKLTQSLWEKFRDLNDPAPGEGKTRLLPILGPSGCGKSSLARAGLIPELARRPLAALNRARVAVFTPGTQPLQALAGVLARIATGESAPVKKTREFAEELTLKTAGGAHDGLCRITNLLPDINTSPLIVFVDQFEELYALCKDEAERTQFIENLLHAAADAAGRVSVILTLRSDFLGETQKHPQLNILIAEQGEIIPAMTEVELRDAIAKPAANAGFPLRKRP